MQIGKISRATVHAYVVAYGMVEAEPAGSGRPAASAHLAAPVAGIVAAANAVEGQHVEKGAELFRLDNRVADVTVEKARLAAEFAAKTLERQRRLLAVDGASQRQVQEAQQQLTEAEKDLAQAQAQRTLQSIVAPFTGTLVRVNVKQGETVDPATVVAELVDLDRLAISASVPSTELAALKIGQAVELAVAGPTATATSDGAALARATLEFIGMQVDPKTGTAAVRISVPPGSGLRPGQFVAVRIVTEERPERLVVPVESIVKTDDGSAIAVVEGDTAKQWPVQVGLRDGKLVEVEALGLRDGMTIVTAGAYGLPKQTKIRVVEGSR